MYPALASYFKCNENVYIIENSHHVLSFPFSIPTQTGTDLNQNPYFVETYLNVNLQLKWIVFTLLVHIPGRNSLSVIHHIF